MQESTANDIPQIDKQLKISRKAECQVQPWSTIPKLISKISPTSGAVLHTWAAMKEKERFDCDSKLEKGDKALHRVANLHQCRTICSRNCAYKLEQSTNSIPENQLSFTNPECRRTLNEEQQPSSQNHPRRKEPKKKNKLQSTAYRG
jgi:hypothetical protein